MISEEPTEWGAGDGENFVDLHSPGSAHEWRDRETSPAYGVEQIGGKARRLIELAAEGLLCPPGFVLSTRWFERWIESNGVVSFLEQRLGSTEIADSITRQLDRAPLPEPLALAVARGLETCRISRTAPLAVRSSAAEEDGANSSFAGIFDTRLGVAGLPQTLEAVRAVWLSTFSQHAIAYRRRRGASAGRMAVIIQRLLHPSIAGTLFSVDPTGRAPTEMVIEYTTGLGAAVVSGSVVPARLRVERSTGNLVAAENAEIGLPLAGTPAFDSLVHAAFLVERVLNGAAADVEWAVEDGRLVILQARPITSLEQSRGNDRDA